MPRAPGQRAPGTPIGAWVAAIARPPAARCCCRATVRSAACDGASSAFNGSSSSHSGAWRSDHAGERGAAALAGRQGAHGTVGERGEIEGGERASSRSRSAARRAAGRRSRGSRARVRSPFSPSRWPSQAIRRRQASRSCRHVGALPADAPGVGRTSSGQRAQQRGLAAAVAAGQRQQLAGAQRRRTGDRRPGAAAAAAGEVR